MKRLQALVLALVLIFPPYPFAHGAAVSEIFGFRQAAQQLQCEKQFLAVPDPKLAEAHLRILTQAPHIAGSPEDLKTAEYVAQKFREAGLETEIVEYKVWLNYPREISVDVVAPANVKMHGPTRERVEGDPYQDDPRVVLPFNGFSPSGDVEAEVIYANYGRPEDLQKLKEMGVNVRGKILLVRYGANFRGVKVFVAQENGAAGVLIYSDPIDDGWFKGDKYPKGPWRPDTGVQRGSIGYMFEVPGDPTTPGFASVPDLPDSRRLRPERAPSMPTVPTTPLSYADTWPILQNLGGPESPRDWQGALPFTYHVGPGPVRVRMHLKQDYALRTIWDVIGRIRGAEAADEWVVAGNHRDAWVYGAVDPNSGTAAQLEAVHALGELLKSGWRPRRTIVIGSWDAEEQGLIGSTEWAEQHARELTQAAAYLNMDIAVAGPNFGASATPSLKQFVREVTKAVPSPRGGTVYQVWKKEKETAKPSRGTVVQAIPSRPPVVSDKADVPVGDLGSGSDYTPFFQHLGVPSADVGSSGPYGVYHSVFDNLAWFKKFADPDFVYVQQMARVYGLAILRLASADVLPYDYEAYGSQVLKYVGAAQKAAARKFGAGTLSFAAAVSAAKRLQSAGAAVAAAQKKASGNFARLNRALREAERALLMPEGLPNRPWFRHSVYAPGEYTGYAAVVLPGINEAIDKGDQQRTQAQIAALAAALNRAAETLRSAAH